MYIIERRSDSELSKKKWRNNSSENLSFSETLWANSSGGFAGSVFTKNPLSFIFISLHFLIHFPFHLLSSFSSCLILSLLFSSHLVFSFLFFSFLFFSFLFFSFLFFSFLFFSFLCSSLFSSRFSFLFSLSLSVSV